MGEDRRIGDRRSGIEDRRVNSFSEQSSRNSNHNQKNINVTTFIMKCQLY